MSDVANLLAARSAAEPTVTIPTAEFERLTHIGAQLKFVLNRREAQWDECSECKIDAPEQCQYHDGWNDGWEGFRENLIITSEIEALLEEDDPDLAEEIELDEKEKNEK